jgi:hypothetical protein
MIKPILFCLFTFSLFAEKLPLKNGVFLGLGASYNSAELSQTIDGTAFSSIFSGSSLVALGESGGTTAPYQSTHNTLAPQAQIGYLHRFSESPWFLSCKAMYQYLGLTFTQTDLSSFPGGDYMVVGVDHWVGHFSISSSQTTIHHQLALLPAFGYFINHNGVYLGAGPVVFQIAQNCYGLSSLPRVNGTTADHTGSSTDLSFSQWMWGGVAQLGFIYSLTTSWFLDCNYSYAVTENSSAQGSSLFSQSLSAGSAYTEQGKLTLQTKTRVTAQSFLVTINKAF